MSKNSKKKIGQSSNGHSTYYYFGDSQFKDDKYFGKCHELTVKDLKEFTRLEKKYLNQLVDQNISASSGVSILWELSFRAKHELEELKKKTMIISTLGEEVEFLEVEDEVKNKIIENRRGGK